MHPFLRAIVCGLWFAGPLRAAPVAPYPPSTLVQSLDFHWDTYTNAAIDSDLWPITWGPDDNLYTAWGDGGGFGGGDHDGRVAMGFARIEGTGTISMSTAEKVIVRGAELGHAFATPAD